MNGDLQHNRFESRPTLGTAHREAQRNNCDRFQFRLRRFEALLMTTAAIAILGLHADRVSRERAKPIGRMTAQQVLQASEPICQAIAPGRPGVTMSADYTTALPYGQWSVTCTDASGHNVASINWDEDTCGLLSVQGRPQPTSRTEFLLRTRPQALACARRWLVRLGFTGVAERPDLFRSPAVSPRWTVLCHCVSRDVLLWLDPYTGLLIFAAIRHSSDS